MNDQTGTDAEEAETTVLDEMAELLSRYKLIPFFGAGISRAHLGFSAGGLAHEMANAIGASPQALLSDIADEFSDQLGDHAFINFLRVKLVVSEVDDAKVPSHRLILSLSPYLLYTTNQDNLFELTAEHYGRRYRRVVTVDDLSNAVPGEPLLIKFHGDLDKPSSLVFGARSYRERMRSGDHPLDIKLRADLLGKRLMFVGYSLTDENIKKLLDTVRRACGGELPQSYLLAFDYDSSMEDLSRAFPIRIVNPRALYPSAENNEQAFERCLKELCDRTIRLQAACGIEQMFGGEKISPRMATSYQVEAVAKIIGTVPFDEAINAYRAVFDQTQVPTSLHQSVLDIFCGLAAMANPAYDRELSALRAALFNFRLPAPLAIQALAAVMALANKRPKKDAFDDFGSLPCPAVPDGVAPIAAAMAVLKLREQGEVITDNFRALGNYWFEGYQDLDAKFQDTVKSAIAIAWPGNAVAGSPLTRPRFPFRPKGFHAIFESLMSQYPQKFKSPRE